MSSLSGSEANHTNEPQTTDEMVRRNASERTIVIRRQKGDSGSAETRGIRSTEERLAPTLGDGSIRCNDFDEDEQRFVRGKIDQDHIRKVSVAFDLEPDRCCELYVARGCFIAALA